MMAQSSGQELLDKVVNQFNKVNDYSATVVVKADVPMIKVLPVKAKIYYKKKDKFKVVMTKALTSGETIGPPADKE